MQIEIEQVERLRFDHGGPVRAASAVAGFGDGFLVVQDDATHAAWFVDGRATAVRLLPPVEGLEAFDEPSATKHLKPDLEAACAILDGADPAVLVMGSGSSPARMRWVLLTLEQGRPHTRVADMTALYRVVAEALEVPLDALNLEGACVLGGTLRWFATPVVEVDAQAAARRNRARGHGRGARRPGRAAGAPPTSGGPGFTGLVRHVLSVVQCYNPTGEAVPAQSSPSRPPGDLELGAGL